MSEYKITCKKHGENEVITHVRVEDVGLQPVEAVIEFIEKKTNTYYTEVGKKAEVYVRTNAKTGKKFLTTKPDSETPNNLDELQDC